MLTFEKDYYYITQGKTRNPLILKGFSIFSCEFLTFKEKMSASRREIGLWSESKRTLKNKLFLKSNLLFSLFSYLGKYGNYNLMVLAQRKE